MDLNVFSQAATDTVITIQTVLTVLKWVYVAAFGMYAAFALVIVAQVKQMVMALSGGFDRGVWVLALAHLGLAVLLLIAALVVL